MGFQVVQHQPDLFRLRVLLNDLLYEQSPIPFGLCFFYFDVAFSLQRLARHKNVDHAVADVVAVLPLVPSQPQRQDAVAYFDELLGRFVHAHHWIHWIIRLLIDIKHLFHRGYKSTVLLRRDDPLFNPQGLRSFF